MMGSFIYVLILTQKYLHLCVYPYSEVSSLCNEAQKAQCDFNYVLPSLIIFLENCWKVKRPDLAHFQEASLDHCIHTDSPPSQYPVRFRKLR